MARFGFPPSRGNGNGKDRAPLEYYPTLHRVTSTSPRGRHASKKMFFNDGEDFGSGTKTTNGANANNSNNNNNNNNNPSKPPHSPRASARLRRRMRARLFVKVFLFLAVLHFFGRTAYHFLYFVKIGYLRYIKFPLKDQRPIPCETDTPPTNEQFADLLQIREAYEKSRKRSGGEKMSDGMGKNKASGSPKHQYPNRKRRVKRDSRSNRNSYGKTSGLRRLLDAEEVYGKREENVEDEEVGVAAQDDSKRMGFGFERFKEESDSESVEQESVPSKDATLGLEEYNYPVEMLSKEQEKDDINEVERRGSAPRRRGSNFASRFFGGLGQHSPSFEDGISRKVIEGASKRATERLLEDSEPEPTAMVSNGEEADFHLAEDEKRDGEDLVDRRDGDKQSDDELAIGEKDAEEKRKITKSSSTSIGLLPGDDTDNDISYNDPKSQLEVAERKAILLEDAVLEAKKRLDEVKEKIERRGAGFAILCICDARTADICAASVANKRAYAKMHEYDFIFVTEALDTTRPMAWSKILAVQKYLPRYKWLLFLDIDTLIMNPEIRLEDIADDNYEQVLGADHNGINSGVWFVKNTRWMRWFLTELWAQEELVRGNYVFHYEQRAFHHLFQTKVWSKNVGTRNEPYNGAEDVRKRSKVVNQCVFNSLLPWYVNGDFVVHLAGMKGVAQCYLFWQYYEKVKKYLPPVEPHEIVGVQLSEEMLEGGPKYEFRRCLSFPTLFW